MARSLFDDQEPSASASRAQAPPAAASPLAERIRPRTLDEVVGQQKVVGPGGFLRRAIAQDRVPSLIFWGPPGSGKTTPAPIPARRTRARFVPFSAVTSGIKEVRAVIAEAARMRASTGRRTRPCVDDTERPNR